MNILKPFVELDTLQKIIAKLCLVVPLKIVLHDIIL